MKVGDFLLEVQTTPGVRSAPGTSVALPLHQTDTPPGTQHISSVKMGRERGIVQEKQRHFCCGDHLAGEFLSRVRH